MSLPTRTIHRIDRGVDRLWKRLPELVFWVFLIGTVAYLGRLGGVDLWDRAFHGAEGVSSTRIFLVNNPAAAEPWTAPGLTYEGIPGAILALIEAGAVALGALLLFARRLRMRILGSMIVVAWTALWVANSAAAAAMSSGMLVWLQALAYLVPFLSSLIVAMRRMGSGRTRRSVRRRPVPRMPSLRRPVAPAIPPAPERLRGRSPQSDATPAVREPAVASNGLCC